MKKFAIVTALVLSTGFVNADNLFQTNNPFPQTVPQSLNNIYEAEPAVMQKEEKAKKRFWFKSKNKSIQTNSADYVVPESKVINEGADNGSFHVFK